MEGPNYNLRNLKVKKTTTRMIIRGNENGRVTIYIISTSKSILYTLKYSVEQFYCELPPLPLFVFHLGLYKYKRRRQRQRQKIEITFNMIEWGKIIVLHVWHALCCSLPNDRRYEIVKLISLYSPQRRSYPSFCNMIFQQMFVFK